MKKIIYSQWDGSQLPFSLNRKEIVDRFMENIMKGMSPGMSLSEMFRSGFSLAGMDFRVMGLEEMVQLLQKQKDDLFSQYNLEQSFERPQRDEKPVFMPDNTRRYIIMWSFLPGRLDRQVSLNAVFSGLAQN